MNKYQNTKIYTIRCYESNDIYVGSTVEKLSIRMAKHRNDYKRFLAGAYNYVTSFEIIKYPSAYIELLEQYPCESKEQKTAREGYHIRIMDCVNKHIAGRTKAEYRRDNSELIKQINKRYYEKNQHAISRKKKQYRRDNLEKIRQPNICECGGNYSTENKARHLRSKKHLKYEDQHTLYLDVLFN